MFANMGGSEACRLAREASVESCDTQPYQFFEARCEHANPIILVQGCIETEKPLQELRMRSEGARGVPGGPVVGLGIVVNSSEEGRQSSGIRQRDARHVSLSWGREWRECHYEKLHFGAAARYFSKVLCM